MTTQTKTLYYVTDGTYSVESSWAVLAHNGELAPQASGDTKYVPDDPTFPTTVFRGDGVIELQIEASNGVRLDEYVRELSAWLKVGLQEMER